MKYKTHIKITKRTDDGVYYLVEGIEYPNLLTSGSTYKEGIEMAIDAWSLLCVVYEDKKVKIKDPISKKETISKLLEKENYNTRYLIIESEDTDEYRKFCSRPEEKEE